MLISSIDNQSYTDAQKITEALLDKSLENPNSRVMVVLNLYEGSNSKVNNE